MVLKSAALFFLISLYFLGAAWAGEPTEKIEFAIKKGIQIVTDPAFRSKSAKKKRIDQLRRVVYPLFDFHEMAKRSLGPHWNRRTPEEQERFVKLFREFLERSYAEKVDLYNGQKAVITNEEVEGYYAEVNSKVVDRRGKEYSVDYRLLKKEGEWKIYDVVVEHISVINNYRSQFHRVISQSSYEDLINRLEQITG